MSSYASPARRGGCTFDELDTWIICRILTKTYPGDHSLGDITDLVRFWDGIGNVLVSFASAKGRLYSSTLDTFFLGVKTPTTYPGGYNLSNIFLLLVVSIGRTKRPPEWSLILRGWEEQTPMRRRP